MSNILQQKIKTFDPYNNYASSEDISLGSFLVEEWPGVLVEPSHPALKKSATINPFKSGVDLVEREQKMIAIMQDNLGVGLAAPQTGSSLNMFVMEHSVLGPIGVYKPEILETQGEIVIEEGCLSFPMIYLKISRPERIHVRYYKNDGETIVETWMDGIDARCFLHEYDHLRGICHIQLVSDFKLQMAKQKRDKKLKKIQRILKRGN